MTMDEYKAKAVQTLNVSEIGFNPYDYLAQSTHPTGEAYWYIPLNIQIKWFRAVYPQGGIDIATEKVENGHRVTAYVYAEHDQKLLASAQCEKYVTLERSDTQEWAQFAAKSIALESAGFGVMYDNASAVPFAVPQPASMQMTLEQAKALPCRIKKYGQMTLGQLALTDPQSMQWIINESNFDDAFKQAAHMIVRSYQSMSA